MARVRKIALVGAMSSTALLGGGAWTLFRAEEIPAQLEAAGDPDQIVIPGIGDQPDLEIAKLRGKTTFFVMVGVADWGSDEGKTINRALNRWQYPEGTQGYIVFDAAGFGFLADKSSEYLEEFSREARFPMYGDFEGVFREVFKLAGGHHGLVVLGPDGEVKLRQSGGIDDAAKLEQLRQLLGAQEPPPGPACPEFELGSVTDEACHDKPCALVFLGAPVRRSDVPGIDDGFEGESEQRWAQMRKAEVRMVTAALRLPPGESAHAVLIGDTTDLEFEGWERVSEADELRQQLGIPPHESAFVVVRDDVVALQLEGTMPFYQFGQIADLVGVEFQEDD
jgi:hypothetical protein